MDDSLTELVARQLRGTRVVLAVSGGRDSMVLLHAALTGARDSVACVASFDHATGAHSARALALVARVANDLGATAVTARATTTVHREADWRAQRWSFLRRVAREHSARVATAHTRDDQVETVLMRTMRGAGARGLAALAADSAPSMGVLRPMLEATRADVAAHAARARLTWEEDPSNARGDHLRNRVRLELLPALARARPSLADELYALGARAAALRTEVERFVDLALAPEHRDGAVRVARERMLGYDAPSLALLWPAIAARAGATLDRRGTDRLVAFTTTQRSGARMQLSGGFEALFHRGFFLVRQSGASAQDGALELSAGVQLGRFRFDERDEDVVSLWSATLPSAKLLTVRAWHAGDRMIPAGGDARRVKGLLRDAGVDAASRGSWPVVLAGDEIVWVPGVRRSAAASARSGRPVVTYHCERLR
ncbi:MAG TPA: tRNA lysidine(34) synthetase TilS [Gemmatimonadaceae bacterium]|jgi:tRNA(Ile)-lysidine synthetase-like protein|nr:tRNA lysidine(34) synthetase TilS [Gemmatimonadaceae bacterium]